MTGNKPDFKKAYSLANEILVSSKSITDLWLSCELGAVVIPNLMYASTEEMPVFCSGIENCSVIALSLKSHIRRASERNLTKAAVNMLLIICR